MAVSTNEGAEGSREPAHHLPHQHETGARQQREMAFLGFPPHPGKGFKRYRVREAETLDHRAKETAKMGHTLQDIRRNDISSLGGWPSGNAAERTQEKKWDCCPKSSLAVMLPLRPAYSGDRKRTLDELLDGHTRGCPAVFMGNRVQGCPVHYCSHWPHVAI